MNKALVYETTHFRLVNKDLNERPKRLTHIIIMGRYTI